MADSLFVYGTLNPERAPEEIAPVVRNLQPAGHGTIRGELFDLGDYPAVVIDRGKNRISGSVFTLPDDRETLARLDAYEEFDPAQPEQSLFVRRKRMVTLADGRRRLCWVYLFNGRSRSRPSQRSSTALPEQA